ncbi:MAG: hypothetical protein ACPGN3_04620 [Opitutales bacterium]
MSRWERGLFFILITLGFTAAQAEERLDIYTPSGFAQWLATHIGQEHVRIHHSPDSAAKFDLAVYTSSHSDLEKPSAKIEIILSDGLPKLEAPESLFDPSSPQSYDAWLYLQHTLFMAVSFSDVLTELMPDQETFYAENVAQFSKTIRLADFQLKRRFRDLESPIELTEVYAKALFPYLKYYGIEYTISSKSDLQINDIAPQKGDAPASPFQRIADQLLKSE